MNSYLIGYDLNQTGQDYTDLVETIKNTFGTWWHHLDSTWIVKSDMTSEQIRDILRVRIDSNDELLVVKLVREAAWSGFNDRGSQWLLNNL